MGNFQFLESGWMGSGLGRCVCVAVGWSRMGGQLGVVTQLVGPEGHVWVPRDMGCGLYRFVLVYSMRPAQPNLVVV